MTDPEEKTTMQGPVCPVPLPHGDRIVMGHGSGGKMTHALIEKYFYPSFGNAPLLRGDDAAVVDIPPGGRLAVSTDSHIVAPLFFPGGDIGKLAVCGTVNDLAMVGARPLWLTAGFILEEGFPIAMLEEILASMKSAAEESGVTIIAGDTKVAERGKSDQLFINTSGVGWVPDGRDISGKNARIGDAVLLSGTVGDHGIAVLAARGELEFEARVSSDIAPLNGLVGALFEEGIDVHVLRDPTRGGAATALNEIACQSEVGVELEEDQIPVNPAVSAACEMLGFDPLYVPNEGKMVIFVPEEQAGLALETLHAHPYGAGAVRIGRVVGEPKGRVLMKTSIGGTRIVDVLAGEMLPRIC
jgi:hydrogenase expression/formation protein HypE